MSHEIRDDLQLAILAARAAGDVVMKTFRTKQEVTFKSPDQPLTQADLAADALLKRMLLHDREKYGWLSEETADTSERLERTRVWLVDPIDGTRSYVAGRAEFTISIGLIEDGEAVAGVVYNPATDEMFTAMRHAGAWQGERRLSVANAVRRSIIAASRSEIQRGEFMSFADDFDLLPTGSTAYKLAKVAEGSADVFLSRGPKSEWDVCAGALIVAEAGGRATLLDGSDLRYNQHDPHISGILATRPELHADIVRRISEMEP
jgi:myo-inositol-1(or 4)-monophosphatase